MDPEDHVVSGQILHVPETERKPEARHTVEGHQQRKDPAAHRLRKDLHNDGPGNGAVAAHVGHNKRHQRRHRRPREARHRKASLLEIIVGAKESEGKTTGHCRAEEEDSTRRHLREANGEAASDQNEAGREAHGIVLVHGGAQVRLDEDELGIAEDGVEARRLGEEHEAEADQQRLPGRPLSDRTG